MLQRFESVLMCYEGSGWSNMVHQLLINEPFTLFVISIAFADEEAAVAAPPSRPWCAQGFCVPSSQYWCLWIESIDFLVYLL